MKYLSWVIICTLVGVSILGFTLYCLVADIVQQPQDLIDFRYRLITTLIVGTSIIIAAILLAHRYFSRHSSQPETLPQNTSPAIPLQTLIALCIDDEGKHSKRLDELLDEFGFTTVHASNETEISQRCQQHSIAISFINFDMQTLDTDKVAACIRAEQHPSQRLPIIATSQRSGKEHICQVLLADYDDYMVVPFSENKLKVALQRWLHRDDITTTDTSSPHSEQPLDSSAGTDNKIFAISDDDISKAVNIEESLKQSNRNPSLAKNMLALLIKMVHEEKGTLEHLYQEKNWEALGQLTHKLYGGSCYCGVPQLQKHLHLVNQKIQQQAFHDMDVDFAKLTQSIAELIAWDQQYDIDIIFDIDRS